MVSLWQVGDLWTAPGRPVPGTPPVPLLLWGVGGEIARGFYSRPQHFVPQPRSSAVNMFVHERTGDASGLLTGEGRASGRRQISSFVDWALATGFGITDLRDAFYTYERVHRWAGANARKPTPSP